MKRMLTIALFAGVLLAGHRNDAPAPLEPNPQNLGPRKETASRRRPPGRIVIHDGWAAILRRLG